MGGRAGGHPVHRPGLRHAHRAEHARQRGTVIAAPRVAYVDNDEVVLAHLRALAAHGNPGVTVVEADVREVAATLEAVSAGIDLSRPVCLLMGALLHFSPPTPRGT